VAARALPTSRNTNSLARHSALHRAHCTGEEILSVRQTGAVQDQRESSTEPHQKLWKCIVVHEARENFRPCLHPNLGERPTASGGLAF